MNICNSLKGHAACSFLKEVLLVLLFSSSTVFANDESEDLEAAMKALAEKGLSMAQAMREAHNRKPKLLQDYANMSSTVGEAMRAYLLKDRGRSFIVFGVKVDQEKAVELLPNALGAFIEERNRYIDSEFFDFEDLLYKEMDSNTGFVIENYPPDEDARFINPTIWYTLEQSLMDILIAGVVDNSKLSAAQREQYRKHVEDLKFKRSSYIEFLLKFDFAEEEYSEYSGGKSLNHLDPKNHKITPAAREGLSCVRFLN